VAAGHRLPACAGPSAALGKDARRTWELHEPRTLERQLKLRHHLSGDAARSSQPREGSCHEIRSSRAGAHRPTVTAGAPAVAPRFAQPRACGGGCRVRRHRRLLAARPVRHLHVNAGASLATPLLHQRQQRRQQRIPLDVRVHHLRRMGPVGVVGRPVGEVPDVGVGIRQRRAVHVRHLAHRLHVVVERALEDRVGRFEHDRGR
jgi:hypothetical protein